MSVGVISLLALSFFDLRSRGILVGGSSSLENSDVMMVGGAGDGVDPIDGWINWKKASVRSGAGTITSVTRLGGCSSPPLVGLVVDRAHPLRREGAWVMESDLDVRGAVRAVSAAAAPLPDNDDERAVVVSNVDAGAESAITFSSLDCSTEEIDAPTDCSTDVMLANRCDA
jgi:hypothetical protein